ncbi:hypothetical protein TNCV_4468571 [Trichonephila clavipes]|nr:hypothetical protein TNCV_4468571 [Trichonephila clavipes]
MDFPPQFLKNPNNIINKLQLCSGKEVAEASMQSAAFEIKTGKRIDAEGAILLSVKDVILENEESGFTCLQKSGKILHVKECLKTTNGSAGMMKTVGMVRIFQRSLSHRSVRYTSYIGMAIQNILIYYCIQPYGERYHSFKIECVGHVQKRMELVYEN